MQVYKLLKFLAKIFHFIYQFNKDQISELLEIVISCILAKLTIKIGVKIGIQSRRWVNIRLLSTDLNFDVSNMFYSINEMPKVSYFLFAFGNNKNRGKPLFDNEVLNIFARIRHELLLQVDQFLLSFWGEKIHSLRVSFFFDYRSISWLDNWIHHVISLEVEEMNILLSNIYKLYNYIAIIYNCNYNYIINKPYFNATIPEDKCHCFPQTFFFGHSTLKHLHLELVVLKAPSELLGINRLETLYLANVIIII